jgi:hypothetical protein
VGCSCSGSQPAAAQQTQINAELHFCKQNGGFPILWKCRGSRWTSTWPGFEPCGARVRSADSPDDYVLVQSTVLGCWSIPLRFSTRRCDSGLRPHLRYVHRRDIRFFFFAYYTWTMIRLQNNAPMPSIGALQTIVINNGSQGCDANRRKDDPAIWKGDGETDRTVYFEPAPSYFGDLNMLRLCSLYMDVRLFYYRRYHFLFRWHLCSIVHAVRVGGFEWSSIHVCRVRACMVNVIVAIRYLVHVYRSSTTGCFQPTDDAASGCIHSLAVWLVLCWNCSGVYSTGRFSKLMCRMGIRPDNGPFHQRLSCLYRTFL